MPLALIVHGGAGVSRPELAAEIHSGLQRALDAGRRILECGGSSVEAVIAAVSLLEDDPLFNAGTGSVLNANGGVEMDAGIMNGATLDIGAVAAVRGVRNPIRLAAHVLTMPQILFAKDDAERLADAAGVVRVDPGELITPWRRNQWEAIRNAAAPHEGGTVGAVAVDLEGHLAAATSTGGILCKPPGRIGDSPLPGCGYYANTAGACSATGWGESIARLVLSRRAVAFLEQGLTAQEAASKAIEELKRIPGGEAGVIVVDRAGRTGAAFNTPSMAYATWPAV